MTMYADPLMSTGSHESDEIAAGMAETLEGIQMRIGSPPTQRETIDRGLEDPSELAVRHGQGREGDDGSLSANEDLEDLDEDDNTADEKNENLSQAGFSSVGSVATESPPATRNLTYLSNNCCRVPMTCKQPDGSQVLAFCGHDAATCSHRGHKQKQVSQSHARGSVAYYYAVTSPNSKSRNGRKDMRCYTIEEYNEMKMTEEADLIAAGEGFALNEENEEDAEFHDEYYEEPPEEEEKQDDIGIEEKESPIDDESEKSEDSEGVEEVFPTVLPKKVAVVAPPGILKTGKSSKQTSTATTSTNAANLTTPRASGKASATRTNTSSTHLPPPPPPSNPPSTKPTSKATQSNKSPTGGGSSPTSKVDLYGLLNPLDHELPRIEDGPAKAMRAISNGWVLDQQFDNWGSAMIWFNDKMQLHRRQTQRDRGTPSVISIPSTGTSGNPSRKQKHSKMDILEGPDEYTSEDPGYIGLERKTPFKRVCIPGTVKGHTEIQKKVDEGFLWVIKLPDYESAIQWVHSPRPSCQWHSHAQSDSKSSSHVSIQSVPE
jgi:hypothetical protein